MLCSELNMFVYLFTIEITYVEKLEYLYRLKKKKSYLISTYYLFFNPVV